MSLIERNHFSPSLTTEPTNMDQTQYFDETGNTSPRETQNINEIRKLIRDQTFLANSRADSATGVIRHRNQNSESSDDLEVPVRRFTPLPDIPRYDDPYYRTESRLNKNDIDSK